MYLHDGLGIDSTSYGLSVESSTVGVCRSYCDSLYCTWYTCIIVGTWWDRGAVLKQFVCDVK